MAKKLTRPALRALQATCSSRKTEGQAAEGGDWGRVRTRRFLQEAKDDLTQQGKKDIKAIAVINQVRWDSPRNEVITRL